MSQIAGIQDFRSEGPPGDIGVFQGTASVIVYQFAFSGVTYTVAQRMGERGWTLIDQGIVISTVIQAAMNSLIGQGGIVFVTSGTYLLTVALAMVAGVNLIGESQWNTIIERASGPIITVPNTASGCSIQSLTVHGTVGTPDGIYVGETPPTGNIINVVLRDLRLTDLGVALVLWDVGFSTFENIHIETCTTGIYIQEGGNCQFSQIKVLGASTMGLTIDTYAGGAASQGLTFFGGLFLNNARNLQINDGMMISFSGTIFDSCTGSNALYGIYGGQRINFDSCFIAGNAVDTTQRLEIRPSVAAPVFALTQIRFDKCYFVGLLGYSVQIVDDSGRRPSYITFDTCHWDGTTAGNVDIQIDDADHVYLTNCDFISATSANNINENGAPTDVQIEGGYVAGGAAKQYFIAGTTVIHNLKNYNPVTPFTPALPGTGVAFPLLPYDANYVVTNATTITGLTIDGTAVGYAVGTIIFVAANHSIIPTYADTPAFKVLPT